MLLSYRGVQYDPSKVEAGRPNIPAIGRYRGNRFVQFASSARTQPHFDGLKYRGIEIH
jgi:hypothetical protein